MKLSRLLLGILLLAGPWSADAQAQDSGSEVVLTLEEAVQIALIHLS